MSAFGEPTNGPRLLVVCTANQFRSPFAEGLLAHRVAELGLTWSIGSAGTAAVPGRPMDARISDLLGRRSVSVPGDWRSRRVTTALLEHTDVVLTMEQHHRRAIVEAWPTVVNRSFLFGQFAHFIAAIGVAYPGTDGLLEAIRAHRGTVQPQPAEGYEIADPAGRSARRLRASTTRIAELIDQMLPLRGPTGSAQRC